MTVPTLLDTLLSLLTYLRFAFPLVGILFVIYGMVLLVGTLREIWDEDPLRGPR